MNTFTRRRFLSLITASAASIAVPVWAKPERTIEVWKDPNCGCCKDWIAHLEQNGFRTKVHDTGNHDARAKLGMPDRYASCHTARTDGYLLEGHVPARRAGNHLNAAAGRDAWYPGQGRFSCVPSPTAKAASMRF